MSEQPPLMWTDTLDSDDDSITQNQGESTEQAVAKQPEEKGEKETLTAVGVTEESAEEGDEQAEGDEGDVIDKSAEDAVNQEADGLAIEKLAVSDAPQAQETGDNSKHKHQPEQDQSMSEVAHSNENLPEAKSVVEEVKPKEEDVTEATSSSLIQEQPSVAEEKNENKLSGTQQQPKGRKDLNRKDKSKDKTMRMWVHDGFEQQQREERMSTPQPARPKPAWNRESKTQARRGGYGNDGESRGEYQKPGRARRLSWGNDGGQAGTAEEPHHGEDHGNQTQDARGGRTMRTWGHDGYDQQQQQEEQRASRQQRSRRPPINPDAPPDRTAQVWGHDGYNQQQEQEKEEQQNNPHNNNRARQRGVGNARSEGAEDKLRSPWGHDGYMQQQKEETQRRSDRSGFGGRRGSDLRSPHPEPADGIDEAPEVTKAPRERKVVRVRPGFGGSYVPPKRTEITMENSPLPPKPEEPRKNRSADHKQHQNQLQHQQQQHQQQQHQHQQHQHHQHSARLHDDNDVDEVSSIDDKEEGVFIPRDIRDYRPPSRDEIPDRSQRQPQQQQWQRSSQPPQQRQQQQDQQSNQQPQYQSQHYYQHQQESYNEEASIQRPHKVITLRRNRAGGGEIWDRGHQLPGRNEVNSNLSDPFRPPRVLQQAESDQLSAASGSPQKPEKKKDRKKKKKSVDEDVAEDKSEKKKDRKEKKGSKRGKKKPGSDPCLIMNIETEKGVRELSYYEGEVPSETALAFCKKYNMGGDGDAQKVFAEALAVHICTNLDS